MEITQIAGPLVLFLLMLMVGLELSPADFKRVLASPSAVIGGTLAQILLLPAMTWAVVRLLDVSPVFGAGAILVAVSPGAGMSNLMAALGRGNVALSVTLTAVTSVVAVLSLPTISAIAMDVFLETESEFAVPVGSLVFQLGLTLLVPIGLGMWLRARNPERASRIAPGFQRATLIAIAVFVVVAIVLADEEQTNFEGGGIAFVAAGVWTLLAMAIGWGTASVLGLSTGDRFTFLIEFSARNIAVASIVALSGLGRIDLSFFSGVYAAVGYPLVVTAVLLRRRHMQRIERARRPL